MTKGTVSLFPYCGGKSVLAMNLVEVIYSAYEKYPYISTFVDACGGGGRLILNLPRRGRQIYSELDPNLVNLFWAVSDMGRVTELIERLKDKRFSVNKDTYNTLKMQYKKWADLPVTSREEITDRMESAAYAYYLTHLSYNGRLNSAGFYTTRFEKGMSIRNEEENLKTEQAYWNSFNKLPDFPEILQGVEFWTGDCLHYLIDPEFNNENTIIYLDPPYLKDSYVRDTVLINTGLYVKGAEDESKIIDAIKKTGKDPLPFNYENVAVKFDNVVKYTVKGVACEAKAFDISLRSDYISGAPVRLHMDMVHYALKSPAKIIISGYDNSIYNRLLESSPKWKRVKMGEQAVVSSTREQKVIETEYIWLNF